MLFKIALQSVLLAASLGAMWDTAGMKAQNLREPLFQRSEAQYLLTTVLHHGRDPSCRPAQGADDASPLASALCGKAEQMQACDPEAGQVQEQHMQQEPEAVAAVADQSWWPFWEEESTPPQQRQQKRSKSQHGQAGQEEAEDVGAGVNVCGGSGDHMHKAQAWLSAGGEEPQKLRARGMQSPLASPNLSPLDTSHTGSVERSADSCEQPRQMCQEQATVRR